MSTFCFIQVVALDPGVRCFQTAYSPNGESAAYCQGRNGYNIVFSLAERVDKIASTLDEDKKAKHKLLTPRKRSHLKKEINRLRQRSQNLVTEVRGLLKQGKKEKKISCPSASFALFPNPPHSPPIFISLYLPTVASKGCARAVRDLRHHIAAVF